MRLSKYILVVFSSVVLFESCCRKVECEERVEEEISFRMSNNPFVGFAENELDSIVWVVYNPITNERFDSSLIHRQFYYTEFKKDLRVFSINAIRRPNFQPLKGLNIILRNTKGSFADTLFNIQFDEGEHHYTCNACITNLDDDFKPFIKNRTLTYKGIEYRNRDFPILITKK